MRRPKRFPANSKTELHAALVKMKNFSFPILDKNDICSRLAALDAPKLSVENLTAPSADSLLPVYDFLSSVSFTSLAADNGENSMQPGFQAVQIFGDNTELYLESYAALKTYRRIQKFFESAGVGDFSIINALHRPDSNNTIRFLSAAINYIMYCLQKQELFAQSKLVRDEKLAKLEEIYEEKAKVEKEISQIEQSRLEESSQVDALEREINELNPQIQALNRQLGSMRNELHNLQQEDAGILNKISSLNYEILQKQQEGAHLRSQLVENPQELERTLREKKAALLEEEALGIKCVGNCEVLKGKLGVILKAEKTLSKLQVALQSVEDQSSNCDVDNILKERKATQKALAKEEWALDVQEGELKWGVSRLEEHSEKLSHQLTAALKDLEAAKAEQQKLMTELNAKQCAVKDRIDMQIEALCKNSEDICMKKKMQISQLKEMQDRLTRTTLKFIERTTPDSDILDAD